MAEYQRHYQTLFDNIPQGIFSQLADGTLADVNPVALEMFGLDRDQFLRRTSFTPIWKVITEDGTDLLPEHHPSMIALRTGLPVKNTVVGVYNPRKKDFVWLVVNAIPIIREGADKAFQVFVTLHDITAQKRAAAALQESEERLRLFIEHAPASLAMFDREMRYLCASRRWFSDCALDLQNLIGKSHYEVFPEIPAEWREAHRRGLAGEVVRAEEDRFERIDGSVKWVRWEIYPWHDVTGEVGGIVLFAEDITDRKQADNALRQAKEAAEAATRAKGQFLANMSHELRTPMTGLLGMLDIALHGELSVEQRGHLDAVEKSAHALMRILNDILDFSKIEAGRLTLVEAPFHFHETVQRAVELFVLEAQRKGLDLAMEIATDTPQILAGDEGRVRQILVNLIGNAVKFTEQGRVVLWVATGDVTVDGCRNIIFTVADTGIGISEDMQKNLFQPFNQADVSHSRRYGGAGLGLSISRELTERMGGTICCTSEPGQGTTFVVTLPLREMTADPSVVMPTECSGLFPLVTNTHRAHLLVAEDDPTIRNLLGIILTQGGIDFDSVSNGEEAVGMWAQGEYDLILMDVQMPRMDGYEATRAIRAQEKARGGHIPIVALTAHAYPTDQQKCLDTGMDAYLAKPIEFQKLFTLIGELLNRNAARKTD